MADFNSIAQQFVEFYYKVFDENRGNLASLYRDNSMLTFESSSHLGAANIVEKLSNLPFSRVKHQLATMDAQPSIQPNSILVQVTGALLVDEEQKPMSYTQTFQLNQDGSGQYFVHNDIFRLVYPASG